MPEAPTWVAAQAILAALEAAFEAAERPHPRRYVSDGGVVWDWNPLMAVEWIRTEPAWAGEGAEGAMNPSHMGGGFVQLRAVYNVHVTRPSPFRDEVGASPEPAAIERSALIVHDDGALVVDTLCSGFGNDTLGGVCGRADFISQMVVGVDGGMVGTITTIGIAL